jgi:hypothetical protein
VIFFIATNHQGASCEWAHMQSPCLSLLKANNIYWTVFNVENDSGQFATPLYQGTFLNRDLSIRHPGQVGLGKFSQKDSPS